MNYIYPIIALLGGLGAFLLGFKILSENIEKIADNKLKLLFQKTSKNRFMGVGIGALVTGILQSSSAVTVMVVGFVNAGLMDLFQATALIMGANIGTTITAQIVALESFDFAKIAVILTLIGISIFMISKKDKRKTAGLALAGLGLVFLALGFMSDSMKSFKNSTAFVNLLKNINDPFLLVLIGLGLTAILQSSSAVSTIVISMAGAGLVIGGGGNSVLFVILGTNVGTCVTALISSLGASTNAKRASIIHLLFNVVGTLIFFIILFFWKGFMDNTLAKLFKYPTTQIAMFHTFFNVSCTLLFLPFINLFVKISKMIVKQKQEFKEETFIDERLIKTPSVALSQNTKEIFLFGSKAMKLLNLGIDCLVKKEYENVSFIQQEAKRLNVMNKNILEYLVKISNQDVSNEYKTRIQRDHKILYDLYRIIEISDNMVKYIKHTQKDSLSFSGEANNQILNFKNELNRQFKLVSDLYTTKNNLLFYEIELLEDKIDSLRKQMISEHIQRLEEGTCSAGISGIYINLVSNLERVGDHLYFVGCALIGKNIN